MKKLWFSLVLTIIIAITSSSYWLYRQWIKTPRIKVTASAQNTPQQNQTTTKNSTYTDLNQSIQDYELSLQQQIHSRGMPLVEKINIATEIQTQLKLAENKAYFNQIQKHFYFITRFEHYIKDNKNTYCTFNTCLNDLQAFFNDFYLSPEEQYHYAIVFFNKINIDPGTNLNKVHLAKLFLKDDLKNKTIAQIKIKEIQAKKIARYHLALNQLENELHTMAQSYTGTDWHAFQRRAKKSFKEDFFK